MISTLPETTLAEKPKSVKKQTQSVKKSVTMRLASKSRSESPMKGVSPVKAVKTPAKTPAKKPEPSAKKPSPTKKLTRSKTAD